MHLSKIQYLKYAWTVLNNTLSMYKELEFMLQNRLWPNLEIISRGFSGVTEKIDR